MAFEVVKENGRRWQRKCSTFYTNIIKKLGCVFATVTIDDFSDGFRVTAEHLINIMENETRPHSNRHQNTSMIRCLSISRKQFFIFSISCCHEVPKISKTRC